MGNHSKENILIWCIYWYINTVIKCPFNTYMPLSKSTKVWTIWAHILSIIHFTSFYIHIYLSLVRVLFLSLLFCSCCLFRTRTRTLSFAHIQIYARSYSFSLIRSLILSYSLTCHLPTLPTRNPSYLLARSPCSMTLLFVRLLLY